MRVRHRTGDGSIVFSHRPHRSFAGRFLAQLSGTEIFFARFRAEDVQADQLVSNDASLKNLVKGRHLGMNRGGAGDKPSAAGRK